MINIDKPTIILAILLFLLIAINIISESEIKELEFEIEYLAIDVESYEKQIGLLENTLTERKELEQLLKLQIETLEEYKTELESENERLSVLKTPTRALESRTSKEYTVTCYDLSIQSCGKAIGSKGYGMTASGFSLIGHTWETARTIATDPRVIPLGSKVELTFTDGNYSKYNGIYTSRDRGGDIKNNRIDFFLGDYNQNEAHPDTAIFGKTKATIRILE